jgi:hypothetical protein
VLEIFVILIPLVSVLLGIMKLAIPEIVFLASINARLAPILHHVRLVKEILETIQQANATV